MLPGQLTGRLDLPSPRPVRRPLLSTVRMTLPITLLNILENVRSFLVTVKMIQDSEVQSLSRVQLFATPWTVAYKAPQSMGFSRHEYWSGLPFPSPADLLNPGIKPESPAL